MAVYYKWIKGCALGANLTDGLWSYIYWPQGDTENFDPAETKADKYLPKLYQSKGRDISPDRDQELYKGYFLTNCATDVQINADWKWVKNTGISFSNAVRLFTNSISSDNNLYIEGSCYFKKKATSSNAKVFFDNIPLEIGQNGSLTVNGTSSFNSLANFTQIKASNTITGLSFNATSDRRAKENITPATYSAIEIIKKLPIYTYNYKNSTETVTGIMAQDLLEIQPQELDLVSNINATGKNDDYMSIKNDKLMFVLMKAIQEQQEKINYLEEELNKLKNN